MKCQHHHLIPRDSDRTQAAASDDLDAFLIDDDQDEFLDRHVAAIRESLSDRTDY
jgi:hypothetical protein